MSQVQGRRPAGVQRPRDHRHGGEHPPALHPRARDGGRGHVQVHHQEQRGRTGQRRSAHRRK